MNNFDMATTNKAGREGLWKQLSVLMFLAFINVFYTVSLAAYWDWSHRAYQGSFEDFTLLRIIISIVVYLVGFWQLKGIRDQKGELRLGFLLFLPVVLETLLLILFY